MAATGGPARSGMSQADMLLWKSSASSYHRRRSTRIVLAGSATDTETIEIEEAWATIVSDDDEDEIGYSHLAKAADAVLGRDAYRPHDIRKALQVLDLDGNGAINYYEFKSYMISAQSASKDASSAIAAATTMGRKTRDGELVIEDMVMVGNMRVTDLFKTYRRRVMMERLIKGQDQPLVSSAAEAQEPPTSRLPPLPGAARGRRQSGDAPGTPEKEGLGSQVKRMFGRIFGGASKLEPVAPVSEPSVRRSRTSVGGMLQGGGRSFGNLTPINRAVSGVEWGAGKSDASVVVGDKDMSTIPRMKSRRLLALDAAAVLSRAEEAQAAVAQALQSHAASEASGKAHTQPGSPVSGPTPPPQRLSIDKGDSLSSPRAGRSTSFRMASTPGAQAAPAPLTLPSTPPKGNTDRSALTLPSISSPSALQAHTQPSSPTSPAGSSGSGGGQGSPSPGRPRREGPSNLSGWAAPSRRASQLRLTTGPSSVRQGALEWDD